MNEWSSQSSDSHWQIRVAQKVANIRLTSLAIITNQIIEYYDPWFKTTVIQ